MIVISRHFFRSTLPALTKARVLAIVCTVFILPGLTWAQAGKLDPTFGEGGLFVAPGANTGNSVATSMGIQSNGKILVAGVLKGFDPGVLRLNANGTLDTTFGQGGVATVQSEAGEETATGIVVQSDGKIVIAYQSRSVDPSSGVTTRKLMIAREP